MVKGNDTDTSTSACPVAKNATVSTNSSNEPPSWSAWLGFGNQKKEAPSSTAVNSGSECPVASLEEAAAHSQDPHPDQQGVNLSTHRMISSIPRGATEEKGPHHQPTTTTTTTSETPSHWVYPSEQQFFNALRKKGWNHVEASTVPSVLEIHNTINERTWKQVQEWEAGMDRDGIDNSSYVETDLKLVRFMGRPKDLSPQAFFWTKILRWSDPPFDRHDWYVQKQPKNKDNNADHPFPIQRYVIDYYYLPPAHPDMPPTPFVDARPALDSPRALYQRGSRFLQEELPGLTAEYYAWKNRQPRYFDGSLPSSYSASTTSTK